MSQRGRGKHFSPRRGTLEAIARIAYAGGWPGRLWGALPGRSDVDVLRHEIDLLPARVGGRRELRLVFLSDLHIGPLTPRRLLDRAFEHVSRLQPDVLVLGGDYVFLEATNAVARELQDRVASVPARVKLAVLGNHDLWTRHDRLQAALERAGAQVLVNQGMRLPAPFEDVAFIGLDDVWSGEADARKALDEVAGAPLILGVAHSPEAVPLLNGSGVRLLLCGHTHGGQVALPSGPILVHGPHGRLWPSGFHGLGSMNLFVSRGLGNVDLPIRLGARPDIGFFRLR